MAAKSLLLPIGLAVADQNTTFEARERMAALVRKGDVPRDLTCDAMVRQAWEDMTALGGQMRPPPPR